MRVQSNPREVTKAVFGHELRCDRCGDVIEEPRWQVFEVTIQAERGSRYPEGSTTVELATDCCKKCWPVAVQALEAAGFTFRVYDGQWFESEDQWPCEESFKRSDWGLQ